MNSTETVSNVYDSEGVLIGTVWKTMSPDKHFMIAKYDASGKLLSIEHVRELRTDADIAALMNHYRNLDRDENIEFLLSSGVGPERSGSQT